MVNGADWEENVLDVIRKVRFPEVRTIEAAIKIMGVLSDVSKSCYAEFPAYVNTELNSIPWWVFSGCDNIFGYLEYETNDLADWKFEFLDNFVDWLMIEKPESFGPFSVEYDMILALETSLCQFRDCYSKNQPIIDYIDKTPLHRPVEKPSIEKEYLFHLNKEFLRPKHFKERVSNIDK